MPLFVAGQNLRQWRLLFLFNVLLRLQFDRRTYRFLSFLRILLTILYFFTIELLKLPVHIFNKLFGSVFQVIFICLVIIFDFSWIFLLVLIVNCSFSMSSLKIGQQWISSKILKLKSWLSNNVFCCLPCAIFVRVTFPLYQVLEPTWKLGIKLRCFRFHLLALILYIL